jgi:hypothetical protein
VDYLVWRRWWQQRDAIALEEILVTQWDPLGVRENPDQRRRLLAPDRAHRHRLRHGLSAEEIIELLASANRQVGVRVNTRQLAGVSMEIRRWYRQEQDDPARDHGPVTYTEPES